MFVQLGIYFHLGTQKKKSNKKPKCQMKKRITSAHFFGSTRRPIRPASLALNIFSNKGVMTTLELNNGQGFLSSKEVCQKKYIYYEK